MMQCVIAALTQNSFVTMKKFKVEPFTKAPGNSCSITTKAYYKQARVNYERAPHVVLIRNRVVLVVHNQIKTSKEIPQPSCAGHCRPWN